LESENTKTLIIDKQIDEKSVDDRKIIYMLPYPIGCLYHNLLFREKAEEFFSFYDVSFTASVILKYLSTIAVADYYEHYKKGKWVSENINSVILNYYKPYSTTSSYELLKTIMSEPPGNNVYSIVFDFREYLLTQINPGAVPAFIENKCQVIDLFRYFDSYENEINSSKYTGIEPPRQVLDNFLNLLRYIILSLLPILELEMLSPVKGQDAYNSLIAQGTSIVTGKIKYKNNNDFLNIHDGKMFLRTTFNTLLPLYPFVCLRESEIDPQKDRGRILFLKDCSATFTAYIDFIERRNYYGEKILPDISRDISSFIKTLQTSFFRKPETSSSLAIDFNSFINLHKTFYIESVRLKEVVNSFIAKNNHHYGIIKGRPGHGKTTFLANFITDRKNDPIVYHFVRPMNNWDNSALCLGSMIEQMLRLTGEHDKKTSEITDKLGVLPNKFLQVLSDTASYAESKGKKLILVIDSVDRFKDLQLLMAVFPSRLPDNTIVLFSISSDSESNKEEIDLTHLGSNLVIFEDKLLPGFSVEEIEKYINKFGVFNIEQHLAVELSRKIYQASFGGEPLLVRLFLDSMRVGQIKINDLLNLDEKPEDWTMLQWKNHLLNDRYYRTKIWTSIYAVPKYNDESGYYFSYQILGLLALLRHSTDDEELASFFEKEVYEVKKYRHLLNKFLFNEKDKFYIKFPFVDYLDRSLFTTRDLIGFNQMIINCYESFSRTGEENKRNYNDFSTNSLMCLADHYCQLGQLTGDYSGLLNLESDEDFRMEQGVRTGAGTVLRGLKLAIDAAIETGEISNYMKFGFLFNDVDTNGIKHGLSPIVTYAINGDFNSALQIVRKIPNEQLRYILLLFLAWLMMKSGNKSLCVEVIKEALAVPRAGIYEDFKNFLFEIIGTFLGNGITDIMKVLKKDVDERVTINCYGELADTLEKQPELLIKISTDAAMYLRRLADDTLRSEFIEVFARIVTKIKHVIKNRQFFENLVFEAWNIADEIVRCKTLAMLAETIADIDLFRSTELYQEILRHIGSMKDDSIERIKLEAFITGRAAKLGNNDWAVEVFNALIDRSSEFPEERTELNHTEKLQLQRFTLQTRF
jgi:hypothetical protein